MAERKYKVTDGQKTWFLTASELQTTVASRPANMPKITVVGNDSVDSVYRNSEGELIREALPLEQVQRRNATGEDVAISGADDPKIQQWRREQEGRERKAIAEEENITAFTNAALPGAQFIQDMAVGKDSAAKARQELNQNVIASGLGNIAEFAIGGAAAKGVGTAVLGAERAGKVGTALGFGKNAGLLRKTGRFLAEDAAIETHFYTQHLLDNNQEFVAEDMAQQVGIGMLVAAPFIGGAAVRAAGQGLRRAAPNILGHAGDALTAATVLSPPGALQTAKLARGAAFTKLVNRFTRKGSGKGLSGTSEAVQKQAKHLDDMSFAGSFTPEKMRRKTAAGRQEALERMGGLADENVSYLDDIDYDGVVPKTQAMSRAVAGLRKQALSVNRKLDGAGTPVKMTREQQHAVITEANDLLSTMDSTGMSEAADVIRRGVLTKGPKNGIDATAAHKALMTSRMEARFRRGLAPGADMADEGIREFMENPRVWGSRQVRKNKKINAAIDDVVAAWDDLGEVHIPKRLDDLELLDANRLVGVDVAMRKLRRGMSTLEAEGMLSRGQVKSMETMFVGAETSVKDGVKSFGDAIKINRARRGANARLQKQGEVLFDIPTSPEGFAAQKGAMVGETVRELGKLGAKSLDVLFGEGSQRIGIRGVAVLNSMSAEEKYEVFNEIQVELPALTGNPMYMQERLAGILDRPAASDPVTADLLGAKIVATTYYLASQMPKPDDTIYGRQAPQPLSKVEEYLEKHIAAYDPISVGYAALDGTITKGMVDSVRVTSPAMYAEISMTLTEAMSKVTAEQADPTAVTGISMFLGTLDPMYTGTFISQLQSTFAQTSGQSQVIGSQGGVNNQPLPNYGPQDPRSGATHSQRQQTF